MCSLFTSIIIFIAPIVLIRKEPLGSGLDPGRTKVQVFISPSYRWCWWEKQLERSRVSAHGDVQLSNGVSQRLHSWLFYFLHQHWVLGGTLKTSNAGIPSAKPLTNAHPACLSTSSCDSHSAEGQLSLLEGTLILNTQVNGKKKREGHTNQMHCLDLFWICILTNQL